MKVSSGPNRDPPVRQSARVVVFGRKRNQGGMMRKLWMMLFAALFVLGSVPVIAGDGDTGAAADETGAAEVQAEKAGDAGQPADEGAKEKKTAKKEKAEGGDAEVKPLKLKRAVVKETDAEKSTVTVTTKVKKKGEKKPTVTETVLTVNDQTAIKMGKDDIKLADIKAGDRADAEYVVEAGDDGDKNVAKSVTISRKQPKAKKAGGGGKKKGGKKAAKQDEGGGDEAGAAEW